MEAVNAAIIYYGATGTVHTLAEAAAEGAEKAGARVRMRRVHELAPASAIDDNPAWSRHVRETADIPEAALDDLAWADVVLFGTPTRFGTPASQLKAFIDSTGPLWQQGLVTRTSPLEAKSLDAPEETRPFHRQAQGGPGHRRRRDRRPRSRPAGMALVRAREAARRHRLLPSRAHRLRAEWPHGGTDGRRDRGRSPPRRCLPHPARPRRVACGETTQRLLRFGRVRGRVVAPDSPTPRHRVLEEQVGRTRLLRGRVDYRLVRCAEMVLSTCSKLTCTP